MPDDLTTDLLPYAEVTDAAYGEQAASGFTARPHGLAVLLSGPCPRCGHATTSVLVDELYRRDPPLVDPDRTETAATSGPPLRRSTIGAA